MLGERDNSQASATCIGVAPSRAATFESVEDWRGRESAEREERHIGNAPPCQVVTSASSSRCARLNSFCTQTTGAIVRASSTCAAVTLLSPRCRTSPCRCSPASAVNCSAIDPSAGRVNVTHHAEVDHVQHVDPQIAQVVVNRLGQLGRALGRVPRRIRAAHRAHLRHDHEAVRIGMQSLADQLIGDVRTVEVAGVDVVDAGRHRLAQHRERRVAVLGRPEHTAPSELHSAVAEAVHDAVAQGEGAGDARSVMAELRC